MAHSSAQKTPPVLAERLKRLCAKIQQKQAGGYLVCNPQDQYYLTGFDGEDGAVLVLPRAVYLLTDGRFAEAAEQQAPWARAIIRKESISAALAKLMRKHRVDKLAFDPDSLYYGQHTAIRKAISPTRLVPAPSLLSEMRLLKDESEIQAIERAAVVAEQAFSAAVQNIRLGMTEQQLAANILHEMLDRGASDASFPIIVAEGPNSSLPHARPGSRQIKAGSMVLIDWGATVDHYRSDLTRVIFIRRIPPRFKRVYQAVLDAQLQAIDAIRPGKPLRDVDAVARKCLKKAGLEKKFTHGLGHGIGLDIHEQPALGPRGKRLLEPGMVITIEPGVYLPGVGGVRIEDDLLVTEQGGRLLSGLSKSLESMII